PGHRPECPPDPAAAAAGRPGLFAQGAGPRPGQLLRVAPAIGGDGHAARRRTRPHPPRAGPGLARPRVERGPDAPRGRGWDWTGMNLADGSSLTVFRLRRADGSAVWAGGSWRPGGADAPARVFDP